LITNQALVLFLIFAPMKNTTLGLLLSLGILFASCGGSKKYSVDKLPEQFVEMGNGGGFTGIYTYYKIATNGQIFTSQSGDTAYSLFGKMPKKIAKAAFNSLGKLTTNAISEPGNLNHFMFRADGDSMTSWLWSDDKKPNKELNEIYETLNTQISNINKTIK